jgi:hypothetical protein
MRVIDGMHRLLAARMRGDSEIEARFFEGDDASSYVLAVKSNVEHGLPLSLADRKVAAARIVSLYPEWSDRLIASIAGVAPNTIASIRALPGAEDDRPSEQNGQLDTRVGRDGRRRPRNTEERRELAARLMRENPRASLREIARQAGISPETVRSVRWSEMGACEEEREEPAVPPVAAASRSRRRLRSGHAGGDRKAALKFLRADPALRSTERGRSLLRMLSFPELFVRDGPTLIAQIPPHCLAGVAEAALECAAAWHGFATKIEAAQGHPPRQAPGRQTTRR